MYNYDFQILQPNEFECLTRDLIQKKEGVFVESFTSGRDNGIDLRYASVKGEDTIVQAKRYKDYANLLRVLKTELPKIIKLDPHRYIVSTSVGLTPANKKEIKDLFGGYVNSTSDILGRDDLNNLLGHFPEVEKTYYKLWIGSTAVLESIINKKIENWSGFELDRIRRDVSTYVMNDSFNEASEILEKNRYVIISGIPGIGKTTLSRMLVYRVLCNGYDQFVKLTSMDDAASMFSKGKKQVFFFDDFLGSSFLEVKEGSTIEKVVSFIDAVRWEPDKLFILSTREYILSDAINRFEKLSLSNIDIAKCTVELSHYTEDIRAKILYNHLAEAELPVEYIRLLLNGKQYLRIIRHKNFNPRIIEAFLAKKPYLSEKPSAFVSCFIDSFDHPNYVWEHAFKKLSPLAQYAMYVRASMGSSEVQLPNWKSAVWAFVDGTSTSLKLEFDDSIWQDTLKLLIGSFVTTDIRHYREWVLFQNPSVFDFMIDMLRKQQRVQNYLIQNAEFVDQLLFVFTDDSNDNKRRIEIKESQYDVLEESFVKCLEMIQEKKRDLVSGWSFYDIDMAEFLYYAMIRFPFFFEKRQGLLSGILNQRFMENENLSLNYRMKLLKKINPKQYGINSEVLVDHIKNSLKTSDDYVSVLDLFKTTERGSDIMGDDDFVEQLEKRLEKELETATREYDFEMLEDHVSVLSSCFSLNLSVWEMAIDEAKNEKLGNAPEYEMDLFNDVEYSQQNHDDEYEEMFTCLLEPAEKH